MSRKNRSPKGNGFKGGSKNSGGGLGRREKRAHIVSCALAVPEVQGVVSGTPEADDVVAAVNTLVEREFPEVRTFPNEDGVTAALAISRNVVTILQAKNIRQSAPNDDLFDDEL